MKKDGEREQRHSIENIYIYLFKRSVSFIKYVFSSMAKKRLERKISFFEKFNEFSFRKPTQS